MHVPGHRRFATRTDVSVTEPIALRQAESFSYLTKSTTVAIVCGASARRDHHPQHAHDGSHVRFPAREVLR